jgi:NitT/TauT family transport system substrate-binding protein
MTVSRLRGLAAALALALALGAPRPAPAAGPTIHVGLICGGMTPLLAEVAFNDGSFQRAGITVEKDCFTGGPAAVQALVGRSIDVFIGSYEHVLRQRARGLDVKAYGEIYDGYSYALLAKSSAPLHGLADAKGQTLAVTAPGSLSDTALRMGLDQAHLNPDRDVTIVAAGAGASMVAALATSRVAAGMLTEPSIARLTGDGQYRVVWQPDDAFAGNVIMASSGWVDANRAPFTTFLRVLGATRARLTKDPAAAIAPLSSDFPQVPRAVMLQAVRHQLTHVPAGLRVSPRGAEAVAAMELRSGDIHTPIPFTQGVDETLLPHPARGE